MGQLCSNVYSPGVSVILKVRQCLFSSNWRQSKLDKSYIGLCLCLAGLGLSTSVYGYIS